MSFPWSLVQSVRYSVVQPNVELIPLGTLGIMILKPPSKFDLWIWHLILNSITLITMFLLVLKTIVCRGKIFVETSMVSFPTCP